MKTLSTQKGPTLAGPAYMNRSQLAGMLWPDRPLSTGLHYLRQLIADDPGLRRRLRRMGWTPQTRLFSPRMVKIILEEAEI